jgi:hypothetical protein
MNNNYLKISPMEFQNTETSMEEKYYLALNENLKCENKRLKKTLYLLEKKIDRNRLIIYSLTAIILFFVLITCAILIKDM